MWSEPVTIFGLGLKITLTQFLILVVFVCLAVGYILAILVNRRQKGAPGSGAAEDKERAVSNISFMKGINYILSERQSEAIEELTKAVSVETETVETYVALGNLFRSRGDIDRAIRIRQSIILRPKLGEDIKKQAMMDLALDYHKGGFFERAAKAYEDVIKADPKNMAAYAQLLHIHEETRDWAKAFETGQRMSKVTGVKASNVLAHYQVEMGKVHFKNGLVPQARSAYKKALSLDSTCVDAYLHLGDLLLQEGKPKKAVAIWRKIVDTAPSLVFLTFGRLALLSSRLKDLRPVEAMLSACSAAGPNPLAHLALARLLAQRGENDRAVAELNQALDLDPGLIEARKELGLLLLSLGRNDEALTAFRNMLGHIEGPEATFQCNRCGFESKELMWRCPQCLSWDTMALHRHNPLLFWSEGPVVKDLVPAQVVDETEEEATV